MNMDRDERNRRFMAGMSRHSCIPTGGARFALPDYYTRLATPLKRAMRVYIDSGPFAPHRANREQVVCSLDAVRRRVAQAPASRRETLATALRELVGLWANYAAERASDAWVGIDKNADQPPAVRTRLRHAAEVARSMRAMEKAA